MNGYVCFYARKRVEVYADTTFAAQSKAAEMLNVPVKKRHQITVVLAEKQGQEVEHHAVD